MTYRFQYHPKALQEIQEFQQVNTVCGQSIQTLFDKLKENPSAIGKVKSGNLKGCLWTKTGRSPEFRIGYNIINCCNHTIDFCKNKPKDDCSGVISIEYFATRENIENVVKGRKITPTGFKL